MIHTITVENYKSIPKLRLDLGRVTVLIGSNGSGKSNILEAIALASAASQDKLDNEFLISRGIRVTESQFMRSAFGNIPKTREALQILFGKDKEMTIEAVRVNNLSVRITVEGDSDISYRCEVFADEKASYPRWRQAPPLRASELKESLEKVMLPDDTKITPELLEKILSPIWERIRASSAGPLPNFLVYAPENSALRTFQAEGQILPLGIKGEGLFAHLRGLDTDSFRDKLSEIREKLKLIEWFEDVRDLREAEPR